MTNNDKHVFYYDNRKYSAWVAWPRSARTLLAKGHRVNTPGETVTRFCDRIQEYNAGGETDQVIRVESLGAEGRPFFLTKFSHTS